MQIGSSNSKNEFNVELDSSDFDPVDQTDSSFDPMDNDTLIDDNSLQIMSDLFSNLIREGISDGRFQSDVSIETIDIYQINIKTGDNGILQARQISDPEQINKALEREELIVEARLSNGQSLMKGSSKAAERAQSAEFINVINEHGQIQRTIETKDVKISVFTPKELTMLSYSMMALFAASEARKRLEIERQEEEEQKKKEEEQLKESLLRNQAHQPSIEVNSRKSVNGKKHVNINIYTKSQSARMMSEAMDKNAADEKMRKKEIEKQEQIIDNMISTAKLNLSKQQIKKILVDENVKKEWLLKCN